MQIPNESSNRKPTARDEQNGLLGCRMTILGLDLGVIERDYGVTFDKIERHCVSCTLREACAVDLKRDPHNQAWEAYCPNSAVLNALAAFVEVSGQFSESPAS